MIVMGKGREHTCQECGILYYNYTKGSKFCSGGCKGMSERTKVDPYIVEKLYVSDFKTVEEIAYMLGEGRKAIENTLKRSGVERRVAAKRFQEGPDNHMWNGGRSYHKGYVYILNKDHPRASGKGYVPEHVLVMEEFIGRNIINSGENKPQDEVVHHINFNRSDNRIENLQIMTVSEHATLHNNLRELHKIDEGGVVNTYDKIK